MTAETMPEPPNRALVGLFNRADPGCVPVVFSRDDNAPENEPGAAPEWFNEDVECSWTELLDAAAEAGAEVVRLYRADDPAVTGAFNAGVHAAIAAIQSHAEAIDWYEGGGVWAEAIEQARKAVKP